MQASDLDPRDPIFFLSSLESVSLEQVRRCRHVRTLEFDTGKVAWEVEIEPGLQRRTSAGYEHLERVLLASRHEGMELRDVEESAVFVHVAAQADTSKRLASPILAVDLQVVAWGEIYRTSADATSRHLGGT